MMNVLLSCYTTTTTTTAVYGTWLKGILQNPFRIIGKLQLSSYIYQCALFKGHLSETVYILQALLLIYGSDTH